MIQETTKRKGHQDARAATTGATANGISRPRRGMSRDSTTRQGNDDGHSAQRTSTVPNENQRNGPQRNSPQRNTAQRNWRQRHWPQRNWPQRNWPQRNWHQT